MKRKLIFLCLGVFLLCGCEMKEEAKFTINEDKSMNIEVIAGFDEELIDALISMSEIENPKDEETTTEDEETTVEDETNSETSENDDELDFGFDTQTKEYTDEERKNYLKENLQKEYNESELESKGLKIIEYQDEKYMGYKITGTVKNIDDLIGTPDFNLDDIVEINSKKIFEKNGSIYKGKIIVGDPTGNTENSSTAGLNLIYTFTLNLPNKAISSNATSISEDGKTLTWNLASANVKTIEFEFEFPSILSFIKNNMFVMAAIAVVVVLLIVIVITLVLKKSKTKNNINELNANDLTSNIQVNNMNNNSTLNNTINNTENQKMMQNNMSSVDLMQNNQILNTPNTTEQNVNIQNQELIKNENRTIENQMITPLQQEQPLQSQNNQMENQAIENKLPQQKEIPTVQSINQPENKVIQPIVQQNLSQESIVNAMNQVPVIQPTEYPINNTLQQSGPVIEEQTQQIMTTNSIPELKPVVPQPVNSYPLPQENVQQYEQVNSGIQGLQFVAGEQQTDNTNINNNQGI